MKKSRWLLLIGVALVLFLFAKQCKSKVKTSSEEAISLIELEKIVEEDVLVKQQVLYELQKREDLIFTHTANWEGNINSTNIVEDTIEAPIGFVPGFIDNFTSKELLDLLFKEVDNRQDYYLTSKEEVRKNFSGVAMVIQKDKLKSNGLYTSKQYKEWVFRLNGQEFKSCASYRFNEQYRVADCSAFAISPNHILTVGHEVTSKNCHDYEFVFDMYMSERNKMVKKIPKENRFIVDYPVAHVFDSITLMDYTILRVLKEIPKNRILKIDINEDYQNNERLYAIGASEGLPLKYAPDGQIINNWSEDIINTNLNVQIGNSGSPVFNTDNKVVGMVVKGQSRQMVNKKDNCVMLKNCIGFGCSGEYILKVSSILDLKNIIGESAVE